MTMQTIHPETITLPRRYTLFIATNQFYFYIEFHLIYDNNGNLITGDGKYREYNDFNQLIRVRAGYDENGRILEEYLWHPTEERIWAKHVYKSDGYVAFEIQYSDENFVREINESPGGPDYDVVYVKDETGFVGEDYIGQRKLFYHNDHLGSTTLVTNSTGQVVENTFYEPFGGIVSGGSRRYDYEGKEFSSETRDYDFHFRKYDSGLKIFTQPDSLLPNLYDPQQLNRYSFERNNPYNKIDPNGHFEPFTMGLIIIILAIWQGYALSEYLESLEEKQGKLTATDYIFASIDITFTIFGAFGTATIYHETAGHTFTTAYFLLKEQSFQNKNSLETNFEEYYTQSYQQYYAYLYYNNLLNYNNIFTIQTNLGISSVNIQSDKSTNDAGNWERHKYAYSDPSNYPDDPEGICQRPPEDYKRGENFGFKT